MRSMNLPERFTGTVYITAWSDPTSALYGAIYLTHRDPSDDGELVKLAQVDVDVPLDAKGTTEKQVAQLRKSKQKIIDEATDRANQIDEAIESLLAIEHEVTA